MVDSGHQYSSGYLDFLTVYKTMVDAELTRAREAAVDAVWWREGGKVRFYTRITNESGATLSTANDATVHAIVYEDAPANVSRATSRYGRAAVSTGFASPLAPGATADFSPATPDLVGVNWDALHFLVLVDYRPGGTTGAYDMLQAAAARPAIPVQAAVREHAVVLTWEASGLFTGYELWRDTNPYLEPGTPAVPVGSGLPPAGCTLEGGAVTCPRGDGLGDPDTNNFYVVKGVLPGGTEVVSNRTGEFDFPLAAGN